MKKSIYLCKQLGTEVRWTHPVPPPARLNSFGLAVDFLETVNKICVDQVIVSVYILPYHF